MKSGNCWLEKKSMFKVNYGRMMTEDGHALGDGIPKSQTNWANFYDFVFPSRPQSKARWFRHIYKWKTLSATARAKNAGIEVVYIYIQCTWCFKERITKCNLPRVGSTMHFITHTNFGYSHKLLWSPVSRCLSFFLFLVLRIISDMRWHSQIARKSILEKWFWRLPSIYSTFCSYSKELNQSV